MRPARFIEVRAAVRYWEDAAVNGQEDRDGTLIPCRKGNSWAPVIDLATGRILNWPVGTEAKIHYKVCDAGEYWLLDAAKRRIAKWGGHYVPGDILCVGSSGHGDDIIFKVGVEGIVIDWKTPSLDAKQWVPV